MADHERAPASGDRSRGSRLATATKVAFAGVGLAVVVVELGALSGSLSASPPGPSTEPAALRLPTPPLLAGSGSWTESRVLGTGAVEVTQWIRADEPIGTLTLTRPVVAGGAVDVGRVVVGSGDQIVARLDHLGAQPRVVDLTGPTELAYVGYVIHGAVDSGTGGEPGRVRVTALDVDYRPRLGPAKVIVLGSSVSALLCAAPGAGSHPVPCGQVRDGHWSVVLKGPARDQRVSAELGSG